MSLVTRHEPAKAHEPSKESFDVPPSPVASERTAVLSLSLPGWIVRSDHFDAEFIHLGVQPVAVIRTIANELQRKSPREASS